MISSQINDELVSPACCLATITTIDLFFILLLLFSSILINGMWFVIYDLPMD